MEKCIYCESAYELEDSLAEHKECFCSISCEERYEECLNQPLEFI